MKIFPLFLYCFFFISITALNGQKIIYSDSDHTFKLKPVPPLTEATNPKAKWGLYFWEFGDGYYKITNKPKVKYDGYAKSQEEEIRVQLVPYYTVVEPLPPPIIDTITIKRGNSKKDYPMEDRSVYIESSANGEVIPGHDIRIALHYKATTTGKLPGGHLVLFYNNIEEKEDVMDISFKPFSGIKDYRLYHDEEIKKSNPDISGARYTAFNRLKNEHEDFLLFKTNSMKAGEDRRIFFTIQSDERLKESTGNSNQNLSFTALWIPDSGAFIESSNIMNYSMKVLKVHDPNIMRVTPEVAFYRKRKKQTFHYRVYFQNEADGIVRNAKLVVSLGKGLDTTTLKILDVEANRRKWKYDCTDADKKTGACFEVVNDAASDSLLFYFHNIDLSEGTFFNRNKGFVKFKIDSDKDKKTALTKSYVGIIFDEVDPIYTKLATTKWREKGLFLKGGMLFNSEFPDSNYVGSSNNFTDQMALGLWYQNATVGKGCSWGIGLDYIGFRIKRNGTTPLSTNDFFNSGGYLTQSENIKLNLAEVKLHGGYQLGSFLKVFATSGFSVPIASKFDLGAKVQYEIGDIPILEDEINNGVFGLFSQERAYNILNKPINTRSFIGYVGSIGLEIGNLNSYAVGIESEYRYFTNFYYTNHDCFKMNNLKIYARFKFSTL